MTKYDVSIIVTVYNKEQSLPIALQSFLSQQEAVGLNANTISVEYIFVDDASSDKSLEIIYSFTKGMKNVSIIRNDANLGPSIRLNQGAKSASGRYLHFVDADDIMVMGCSEYMHSIISKFDADVVYGKICKIHETLLNLWSFSSSQYELSLMENKKVITSDYPLDFLLKKGGVGMAIMVKKSVFDAIGGCDERIFIQDESLFLNVFGAAKTSVWIEDAILYVSSLNKENLSANKAQQHHDRFLAYYFFWQKNAKKYKHLGKCIFYKSISCYWKYIKQTQKCPYLTKEFIWYLWIKATNPKMNTKILQDYFDRFAVISEVRKVS